MTSLGFVAFIGAGNMAEAIFAGLIESNLIPAGDITASDPNAVRLKTLQERYGIVTVTDNVTAVTGRSLVVLAVKPQMMDAVLLPLSAALGADTLVVSVAAGVTTQHIQDRIGSGPRVVRVMPNTPALVGKGASAIAAGKSASAGDVSLVERLFGAVGATVVVDELQLSAITAVSGSGPAYVFLLAEALAEAGTAAGLPADLAHTLARQTLIGAAAMLENSTDPASELRRRVTSPGGTTAAGLAVLDQHDPRGLRALLGATVAAAAQRADELAGGAS